ncbi:hypothetical protein HOD29_07145 [archaeon]|jgi:hypothetical protein|nr:hypothetical protein [archaeon]
MDSETEQCNLVGGILIGRSDCDNMVKFPFYWAEEILSEAQKLGFDIVDLKRENFTEEIFKRRVENDDPFLIFLNGHGDEFCAMGYKKCPVITINKNDHLLKDRIAHVISCKTALFLGQSAIDKGCKGYIGYTDLFHFLSIDPDPSKDIISKIFMEAVNVVSITLLKGGSVKDAYENSQKVYRKHITECTKYFFGAKKEDSIKREHISEILGALLVNKKNQIFISS